MLRAHAHTKQIAILTTALLALLSAGCSASMSASVSGGVISGDEPYRAIWKQSWEQIRRDEVPYSATATSPGACNIGAAKQACVDADTTLAVDLQRLQKGLKSVLVPAPYRRATNLTLLAVSHDLRGLSLRVRSLSVGDLTLEQRNASFRESKVELLAAEETLARAWAAFPAWALPSPQPRV
jgi:hypothetical protein